MLPKRKKIIVLTAVLVVIIGAIVFLTPSPIPEEEAIARVRDHFEEWEDIKIIKTELRPPTEQEKSFIRSDRREPPSLVWVVEAHLKECFGTDQHGVLLTSRRIVVGSGLAAPDLHETQPQKEPPDNPTKENPHGYRNVRMEDEPG